MYQYKTSEVKVTSDGILFNSTIIITLLAFILGLLGIIGYSTSFLEESSVIATFAREIVNFQSILLWIIGLPLLAAALSLYIDSKWSRGKNLVTIIGTCITYLIIVGLYPQVLEGDVHYELAKVLGTGLNFQLNIISYFLLVMTGILWLMTVIYASVYMQQEDNQKKFNFWLNVTFSSILGTILANDFFTMFLFFEMMTISSYFLVVHKTSKESISAGNVYIFMGIGGGLCVLLAMILTKVYTGVTGFMPAAYELSQLSGEKYIIAVLFLIGFGMKAGMLPFHIWLPKTYVVTVTPVNVISSGVMIKIGAYGLVRVFSTLFTPSIDAVQGYQQSLWYISRNIGAVMIWLGIITMLVGVFMALQQGNIKKMLAYHSISQMGYIIMGIGVATYLGYKGAMGFVGSFYHIFNHTLFKSLLFMVAGVVYLRTKEIDMYKLGGLWRKMPFTAALCLIAALGITGMPLFNGFASKSILHHAIDEAYVYGHYSFKYAEVIFTIASAGTVCSFIKLFGFVFLKKPNEIQKDIKGDHLLMCFAMSGLALLIIIIGIAPNFILNNFLIPAAQGLNFDAEFIERYINNMDFFHINELMKALKVYLLGGVLFIIGVKYDLFHIKLPTWLNIEKTLFRPFYRGIESLHNGVLNKYDLSLVKYDVVIYAYMLCMVLYVLLQHTSL
ncbi:Formate hydrogenlyase subunit 3/Multisubunit Na+/H+ antiporter, MnhD subunit [Natronincola peptidivorans]|uniref:Formate hydrogenlyase subunit 3/Multisubunit Na+/H+ antiporter, MnhD subunit n=1 Tax=Natronincola peptidivorans TaxID=426128 RepID=A0A1I0BIC8_9FIRM|nr:complex I subunit 5 family protein [Natronincola peptidivorans]SET06660.1 Formate hydrogenlyase subunit 3/Multisubunit Na+/H+ antiporter, MnhD subunit [Natronincola peptidivorans]